MQPGWVIQWAGVSLRWGALFHLAAAVTAIGVFQWVARRRGVPVRARVDGGFAMAAGAWVGSWLVMAMLSETTQSGLWARLQAGGHSSAGALGGALLAVAAFSWGSARDPSTRAGLLDAMAPALALGEAWARGACFLNGCCHGRPSGDLAWGVTFPVHSACLYRGVAVHPTQLYLAIPLALLGLILLVAAMRGGSRAGSWLAVYLVAYGVLRFSVEAFRGDWHGDWAGLRWNQWVALSMAGAGVVASLGRRRRTVFPNPNPLAAAEPPPLIPGR